MPYRKLRYPAEIQKLKDELYNYSKYDREFVRKTDRLKELEYRLLHMPNTRTDVQKARGGSGKNYRLSLINEKELLENSLETLRVKMNYLNEIIFNVAPRHRQLFIDHFIYDISLREMEFNFNITKKVIARTIELELERIIENKKRGSKNAVL